MYVFTELEVSISKEVRLRRGGDREGVRGKGVLFKNFLYGLKLKNSCTVQHIGTPLHQFPCL